MLSIVIYYQDGPYFVYKEPEIPPAVEDTSIVGTVARLAAEAVGVASAAVPALVGKAALRAGSIRYTTQAFSWVSRGVIRSGTWRAAAVFTGTRISKYLASGWISFASAALMAYDGYQLATWLWSDEEKT